MAKNKNIKTKGPERSRRIVVAMSGGVDSSVAAALLKRAGFDVVGIMMKFWTEGKDGKNRCCSVESERLAGLVAKKIGIPFYVVNAEKEFKKKVVDYFLKEYKKGNTPNPCVVCNKEIKFGFLINKALSLGADFVATGHYARTSLGNNPSLTLAKSNFSCGSARVPGSLRLGKIYSARLFAGKDEKKDQSYFLWQLNQKQLSHVLFPVGRYTKSQVRALAKKFNLPTAETPESMEVCFVQENTNNFLKKYLKPKHGKIIDVSGKVLGSHNGLWFYTIGQRRGLEIPQGPAFAKASAGKPFYVVAKDFKKNILIVSKNEKDLLKKEFIAKDVNWILPQKFPIKAEVKIRYKSNFAKALIRALVSPSGGNKGGGVRVIFAKPQKAITPGQSAVFYKGKELIGGGVIE